MASHRETVQAGQHDVEQHQVEALGQRARQPLPAIGDGGDLVTVEDEHVDQPGTDRFLVLDHEQARLARHAVSS